MSLNLLIASPGDERTLTELILSCQDAKKNYPELGVTLFTAENTTEFIRKIKPSWMVLTSNLTDHTLTYDLVIQLIPDHAVIMDLEAVPARTRSGVRISPHYHIQGSWAQLYMATLGARRFTPFTLRDVFYGIIDGEVNKNNINENYPRHKNGKILIDLDLDNRSESMAHFIQDLYRVYPGRVEEYTAQTSLESIYAYIGSNTSVASYVSNCGGISIHFIKESWDFSQLPSSVYSWNVPTDTEMDLALFHKFIKFESYREGKSFRLTNEYLGNLFTPPTHKTIEDNAILFDHVFYVTFNFVTSLREVNIPVPVISSTLALKNKGIISVLNKITHLNKFGIKFIQDFLDASKKDSDELIVKMSEIDDLTGRSLSVYPELDLLRLYIQFLKAKVPGNHFEEIAKNMILTFNEINQITACVVDLLSLIVNENKLSTSQSR